MAGEYPEADEMATEAQVEWQQELGTATGADALAEKIFLGEGDSTVVDDVPQSPYRPDGYAAALMDSRRANIEAAQVLIGEAFGMKTAENVADAQAAANSAANRIPLEYNVTEADAFIATRQAERH